MKLAVFGFTLAGLACLAFAAWGLYTPAGQTRFDEMDGIYPYLSGFVGWILSAVAICMLVWIKIRS